MPNEVEIVVKSTDRTDFSTFGKKARTRIRDSVKGGLDDAERTAPARFSQLGDRAGSAFSDGVRRGMRPAAHEIGQVGEQSDQTSVAARRMGLAIKEAGDRAVRAQRDAVKAAAQLKVAEEEAAGAQRAAAEAADRLERGEIKEAEAKKLAAEAARKVAAAERMREAATDAAVRATRSAEKADLAEAVAAEASARAIAQQAREADKAADKQRKLDREAALSAAAQQLSQLKAAGSAREYNRLLARTAEEHGSLKRTALSAFKEMEVSGSRFGAALDFVGGQTAKLSGMWRVLPSAIIMGLQLLPTVASGVGGALALALGGAFAFIGLKAQASNKDVRKAFSDTRKHVVDETKKMTEPFHDTLLHMAADATHAFDSVEPSVNRTFSKVAPALTKFDHQLANSFSRLNPMIDSIGTAFSRVLGALGPRMGAIMNNIGTGIKAVMDGVSKNPKGFVQIIEFGSKVVRVVGDVIGVLARFSTQINMASGLANAFAVGPLGLIAAGAGKLNDALSGDAAHNYAESFVTFSGAAQGATGSITRTNGATQKLLSSQKAATMTTDQLKAALDRLTGSNQSAFDSQTQYREALRQALDLGKKNNAGVDANSAAADKNREALSGLAEAIKSNIENGHLNAKQIQAQRKSFIDAAESMGVGKARAKELADQLLGVSGNMKKIPKAWNSTLTVKDDTKKGRDSANKGLSGWVRKIWTAELRATSKVSGAVKSAISSASGFAKRTYRAELTAQSRVSGAVRSAISSCTGFAKRLFRAQLTAQNRVGAALASALRDGYNWARRTFTATFAVRKVLDFVNPFNAHGGIIGGLASGGIARGQAGGGPGGSMTWVGEQGPELVRLPTGSQVYPAGQSRQMAAQAGAQELHLLVEWVGGSAPGPFFEWLRENIRIKGGLQKALGT